MSGLTSPRCPICTHLAGQQNRLQHPFTAANVQCSGCQTATQQEREAVGAYAPGDLRTPQRARQLQCGKPARISWNRSPGGIGPLRIRTLVPVQTRKREWPALRGKGIRESGESLSERITGHVNPRHHVLSQNQVPTWEGLLAVVCNFRGSEPCPLTRP